MIRVIDYFFPETSPVRINKLECAYKPFKEHSTLTVGVLEGVHTLVNFAVTKDVEAVEFTFALYDVFDHFLGSVQGLAGPGIYKSGKKKHRSKWVFDLDGAFSQYHCLCFPSQVRLSDGTIWRCDREKCVYWLNEKMKECGEAVNVDDIFIDGGIREGMSD